MDASHDDAIFVHREVSDFTPRRWRRVPSSPKVVRTRLHGLNHQLFQGEGTPRVGAPIKRCKFIVSLFCCDVGGNLLAEFDSIALKKAKVTEEESKPINLLGPYWHWPPQSTIICVGARRQAILRRGGGRIPRRVDSCTGSETVGSPLLRASSR